MPSRMVSVSASVDLPLHHKVQKFSSGTGSPGWSQRKGHKMVVWGTVLVLIFTNCAVIQLAKILEFYHKFEFFSKSTV